MNSFDKMVTKSTFFSSSLFYIAIEHCYCNPLEHAEVFCRCFKKKNLFKHLFLRHSWAMSNVIAWFFLVAWRGVFWGVALVRVRVLGVSLFYFSIFLVYIYIFTCWSLTGVCWQFFSWCFAMRGEGGCCFLRKNQSCAFKFGGKIQVDK